MPEASGVMCRRPLSIRIFRYDAFFGFSFFEILLPNRKLLFEEFENTRHSAKI
jgi:hypothetical protein